MGYWDAFSFNPDKRRAAAAARREQRDARNVEIREQHDKV